MRVAFAARMRQRPVTVLGPTPANTVLPAVTGTLNQGDTLTTTNGTWSNSPTAYAYQWYSDSSNSTVGAVPVTGSTASTLTIAAATGGVYLYCRVTAINSNGSNGANSNIVGPTVAASAGGTARSATTLTRTSTNTTYPPTVQIDNRPTDWIDSDKLIFRASPNEDMSNATESSIVTLAQATTSVTGVLSALLPSGTTGARYLQCAAWDGTGSRPGTLNWSNIVGINDTVAATLGIAASLSVFEGVVLAADVLPSKGGSGSILTSPDEAQLEIVGTTLRWANNGTQQTASPVDAGLDNIYNVTVGWTTYAGVTTTKDIAVTVAPVDRTPDVFTFTDVNNATNSTQYTSNAVAITGVAAGYDIPATVTGAQYQLTRGGVAGSWTAAGSFTVRLNDTIALRGTTGVGTGFTGTLNVNGVSDSFDVSFPAAAVLDAASKTTGVTLSGGATNVATMVGTNEQVYTVKGPSTGKFWFEATFAFTSGESNVFFHDKAGYPAGTEATGWIYLAQNTFFTNGTSEGTFSGPSWGNGSTLTFAIDADNNKLWVFNGSNWFGGDPGAGGAGMTVADVGNFFAGFRLTTGGTVMVNAGHSSFVRPMASGFTALKDA